MSSKAPSTIWTYRLNGVQTEFGIKFDYLSRKFIEVNLIGKDRKKLNLLSDYRFINPRTIKTTKAWGDSDGYQYIEIRRVTSATDLIVDFTDGSILRANDLTTANLQAMHIAEEARGLAADSISVNDEGQLDARARRIVNLGNPIGRLDAVNKAYVDDASGSVIDSKNKALQYRNEAQRFRNEAEGFKNTASSKASEISSKIAKADSLNNEAKSNASKALEAVAGAQRSAQEAASSASKAKTSEKNAKISEDKAREFANIINPDTYVKKSMIAQSKGNDVSLVASQDLLTKEVNKLMPKTGGVFTGDITINTSSGSQVLLKLQKGDYSNTLKFFPTANDTYTSYFSITDSYGSRIINLPKEAGVIALTRNLKKPTLEKLWQGSETSSVTISINKEDSGVPIYVETSGSPKYSMQQFIPPRVGYRTYFNIDANRYVSIIRESDTSIRVDCSGGLVIDYVWIMRYK